MAIHKTTVNFLISDRWATHLPGQPTHGTRLSFTCPSTRDAAELANELAILTASAGHWPPFNANEVKYWAAQGQRHFTWSNESFTHHCELLVSEAPSRFTSAHYTGDRYYATRPIGYTHQPYATSR